MLRKSSGGILGVLTKRCFRYLERVVVTFQHWLVDLGTLNCNDAQTMWELDLSSSLFRACIVSTTIAPCSAKSFSAVRRHCFAWVIEKQELCEDGNPPPTNLGHTNDQSVSPKFYHCRADLTLSQPAKLYRPYMRPFAKVFLGAMFTYQVLYWAWEKLRLDELREQKMAEMKDLEAQLELYKERQRLEKEQKAGGLQTMQSGLDSQVQGKSKSWFSW